MLKKLIYTDMSEAICLDCLGLLCFDLSVLNLCCSVAFLGGFLLCRSSYLLSSIYFGIGELSSICRFTAGEQSLVRVEVVFLVSLVVAFFADLFRCVASQRYTHKLLVQGTNFCSSCSHFA